MNNVGKDADDTVLLPLPLLVKETCHTRIAILNQPNVTKTLKSDCPPLQ
jgi:hypothetical protein